MYLISAVESHHIIAHIFFQTSVKIKTSYFDEDVEICVVVRQIASGQA